MKRVKQKRKTGYLQKVKSVWYLTHSVSELNSKNEIVRKRVKVRLGPDFTEEQAREVADEYLATAGRRTDPAMTVAEFIERLYWPEFNQLERKYSTTLHMQYMLDKHIVPAWGSRRLTSILHEDVQELVRLKQRTVLTKEKRPGYSPKTLRLLRAAVSTVFALAIKKRAYFGPNPAVGVNLPAAKRVFPKQALTVEQARQFIAALQGVARVVVMLAIMTSMNRSEWLALVWSRINLEDTDTVADGELLPAHSLAVRSGVYRGKFDTTKTANRERIIPIPAVVVEALRELKGNSEWTDPEDLVFVNPNKRGEPLNARHLERTAIKPVAKELGFGWFSWHSARRTFSSLSAGLSSWSLTDRIAQMGHSGGGAQTEAYAVSPLSRRRIGVEDIANRLIPTEGDGPGAQAAGPGAQDNKQPGAVTKKPAKKALVLAVQHQKDTVWGMS